MARYWVGGGSSVNWDATANTNWGTASNTQDNASVPGVDDDVFFDGVGTGAANSTLSANITINSLDMTGYINTLTHNASVTLTVDGNGVNFKLATGMTYTLGNATTSALSFTGTSGTTNIYTLGKTLGNETYNGIGGTWLFQDDHTSGGTVELTNGTLNTNAKTCSFGNFASNNSNVRTATFTNSTVNITSTGLSSFTFGTTTSNLTFNSSGSTVKFTVNSASSKGMGWGGQTFNNVWLATAGTGVIIFSGNGTFNDLKFDPATTLNVASGGYTFTVTTFTATGTAGNVITLKALTNGNTWNLSKSSGQVSSDYLSLRDSAAAGGASWYAGANSTDVGGNSGWVFTAPPANTFVSHGMIII